MSSAKQRVLNQIEKLSGNETINTSDLARHLQLSRSVVSHYLNQLVKEKKVKKIADRPVKWQKVAARETNSDFFGGIIGGHGSLEKTIQQLSAAAAYPPDGLNVLITGNSGVGKSYLASKLYIYAQKSGVIAQKAPYIVLNCANYANNPELISSMLFGYVRGAFTGADTEKDGLLKQADGGYLFLDEVHRLSNENQEKLFSFIDSHQFYKMGDNVHPIKAKVRIIMATTENPEQVLLPTFLRRIPVRVNLPDYIERPVDERLELINSLFHAEAHKIAKKIIVDKQVTSALVQLKHPGNIGYLKNVVEVSCAAAYQDSSSEEEIVLHLKDLQIDQLPRFKDYGAISVEPHGQHFLPSSYSMTRKLTNIISSLKELLTDYSTANLNKCRLQIQAINQFINKQSLNSGLHVQHEYLFQKIIEKQYGLAKTAYLEPIIYALYEHHFRLSYDLPRLGEVIAEHLPRSLHVAEKFYEELPVLNPKSKISLTYLFAILLSDHVDEKIQLRGLMVAHGENTATSIQAVINSLCGNYVFDAIDMPIDANIATIAGEANKLIASFNTTNGFILMVDMGSLSQLYSQISSQLDGDLLVVNNLTTLTALDLGLKMKQNLPFKQIAEKAEQDYQIGVKYYEGFSQSVNILVSCISGLGIAEKISDLLRKYLPVNIKVIPLGYNDLKEKIENQKWAYFKQTLFVLTTIDITEKVEFNHMNLYDILDSSGENKLKHWLSPYLNQQELDQFNNELLRFFSKEGISERLSFLNPDVVLGEVETINKKYEDFYNLKLDGKVKLNLYMHIALMIERLMVRNTGKIEVEPESAKEKAFFEITKSIFQPIELKYNIKISTYEISLLYELFKQFI